MNQVSIVFGHYKNGELLGYRADTFGTLTKRLPKIYTYSPEQVETILKNIKSTLGEKKPSLGEALEKMGTVFINQDGQEIGNVLKEAEEKIYQQGQEARAFEVRVEICPDKIYEENFNVKTARYEKDIWPTYPIEEMTTWLASPSTHKVIETHYFTLTGELNLS